MARHRSDPGLQTCQPDTSAPRSPAAVTTENAPLWLQKHCPITLQDLVVEPAAVFYLGKASERLGEQLSYRQAV